MKKISLMLLAAAMTLSVCCCAGTNGKEEKDGSDTEDLREAKDQKEEKDLPEIHAIAYDESMDTLKDEAGADAFNHKLDHAESRYYKILDYYNMESDETLHILSHFEIAARVVRRKQHLVVYIKDSTQVMDVLGLIGATDSMMKMQNVQILKSIRNQANRSVNCDTANIRKALRAADRQISDIRLLQEAGVFEDLPESLREIAQLRITFPEATLSDLGEMLDEPVGKSGVNHRLKKIAKIAEKWKTEDEPPSDITER